ncbi:TPA: hypothetical protein U2B86_000249 [Streptococcus suis]|nr:hypothetical protein [Streptococcus suis]
MKSIKRNRFWIIYIIIAVIIGLFSVPLSKHFTKLDIKDFIGDVLNFSSIMTGFLGAMLGILASISKSTALMKTIFETEKAKLQLILSVIVPFSVGLVNIIICAIYRLLLQNQIESNVIAILFISSTLYFLLSSIVMITLIFIFYFFDDNLKVKEIKQPQKRTK